LRAPKEGAFPPFLSPLCKRARGVRKRGILPSRTAKVNLHAMCTHLHAYLKNAVLEGVLAVHDLGGVLHARHDLPPPAS